MLPVSSISSHFNVLGMTSSFHHLRLYLLAFSGKPFCFHARQAGCAKELIPPPPPPPPCPRGACFSQCLMGVGIYITQLPNTESCSLHLSPKFSCGIKLPPPTVETSLLMYLLLAVSLPLCYFPTLLPVFHELVEKQLLLRLLTQRSASGEPKQRYAPILPRQFFSPKDSRVRKVQYMQKATTKWKTKYCFLNSWVSTQYSPVCGGKTLDGECGLSLEEGSLRSPACYILCRCADNMGWKTRGMSTPGCRPLRHSNYIQKWTWLSGGAGLMTIRLAIPPLLGEPAKGESRGSEM